jgi:hypothetical protein
MPWATEMREVICNEEAAKAIGFGKIFLLLKPGKTAPPRQNVENTTNFVLKFRRAWQTSS